jgi:hypothetical protein
MIGRIVDGRSGRGLKLEGITFVADVSGGIDVTMSWPHQIDVAMTSIMLRIGDGMGKRNA